MVLKGHFYLAVALTFIFYFYPVISSYTASTTYQEFRDGELNKHEKLNTEMIAELRKKVDNGELAKLVNDKEIIMFLHSSFFDVEQAYNMIKINYDYRKSHKNYFKNRDPTSKCMIDVKNNIHFSILSTSTSGWHIYTQIRNNNSNYFCLNSIVGYFFMIIEYLIKTQGAVNNGIFTINFDGFTLLQSIKFFGIVSPSMKKFMQDGMPIRVTRINILNCNKRVVIALNSVLNERGRAKLHFINKSKMLEEYGQVMPEDIGGNGLTNDALTEDTYSRMVTFYNGRREIKKINNSNN